MAVYKLSVLILLIGFISNIICEEDVIDFKKLEARNRIVGGTPVTNASFTPYQVLLYIGGRSICGGTLIKLDLVLTAAHCVYIPYTNGKYQLAKPHELQVIAGVLLQTSNPLPLNTRQVIKVTPHKKYSTTNNNNNDNDVALLKLATNFNESTSIRAIPMRTRSTSTNERCTVSGWGILTENSTSSSSALMMVTVPIRDHSSCKSYYKSQLGVDVITKNMICAGEHQRDACQGDSGGPLVCNSELAGVVSFGIGCGRAAAPGVYMEVAKYNSWIAKNSADRINPMFSSLFVILSVIKYYLSV